MDNEIVYSSKATDQKAQYDASAKRLLGQKIILAHILITLGQTRRRLYGYGFLPFG